MRLALTISLPSSADETDIGRIARELLDFVEATCPRGAVYALMRQPEIQDVVGSILGSAPSSPIIFEGKK